MKKWSLPLMAALAGVAFAGCTSVESTRKFNGLGVGTPNDESKCFTQVVMTGYYFWGLPLVVGSAAESGKCAMFRDTLTVTNAVSLLTSEARRLDSARVIGISSTLTESMVFPMFISKKTLQVSGTGVRTKSEASRSLNRDFAPGAQY